MSGVDVYAEFIAMGYSGDESKHMVEAAHFYVSEKARQKRTPIYSWHVDGWVNPVVLVRVLGQPGM